jgi:hypothetical protein
MAAGPDRIQEERHTQNLQRFHDLDDDLRKNTDKTEQALREVSSVRHNLLNLRQSVEVFFDLYREEKKDRKVEMQAHEAELRKLSNRFIWAMGLFTGLSIAGHFLFDLLSPLTRHIFQ